ncbi:hypothetical protein MMC28_001107 [Mycoblastus sanguinarius]|nr:hypothetical protein [Mycoblastus sanguinarius]
MSVFGLERNQTSSYDHPINLVDTTKQKTNPEEQSEDGSNSNPLTPSGTLNRQWTKGYLRKELARRKYAKWQEGKGGSGAPTEPGEEIGSNSAEENGPEPSQDERRGQNSARTGRLRDRNPFRTKKQRARTKEEDAFIDVLYENQRGSFFFGIPLYSSKSLLNLDPSAWQNSTFQDSAVNITNAQLPDPSWGWAWKTWYVDMSHDVDEEGWEYSLSFNKFYAWHGSHPWFHSFVRRRRWLRKRVRIHSHKGEGNKEDMKNAHKLTADYFTIHAAKRDRSRGSSAERSTINRSSYLNGLNYDDEDEDSIDDISNISALMTALKRARVDREKIAAVKAFLDQGGDEIFYLAESMPTILAEFIHQTSRRQLQTYLLQVLDNVTDDDNNGEEDAEKVEAKKCKIDNLLRAVHAAGVHVNDADYWSDLRKKAASSETDPTNQTHALDATEPADISGTRRHSHSDHDEPSVREEIKGIPRDAHISKEPRIRFDTRTDDSEDHKGPSASEKGKEKA